MSRFPQVKKQDNYKRPEAGDVSVREPLLCLRGDLKADAELSTAVKAATVGVMTVLCASMVMLLVYLNRAYFSATAPAVADIDGPANYTAMVVPEIEEHGTPRTWPTRKVADTAHMPYDEDDSEVTSNWTPYSDFEVDSVSPFFGETGELPASELSATEPAVSALGPVANVSSIEEEAAADVSTLTAMTTEEVASASVSPFFGETTELSASESPATEPAVNPLGPVAYVSSREEEAVAASASTLTIMTTEEVAPTSPADNVTIAENIGGRPRRDEAAGDEGPPTTAALTANVPLTEQPAANPATPL